MHLERRKLYRSRNSWLFGVCKGLANYCELPTWAIRLLTVFLAVITSFVPVFIGYVLLAIFMKPAPRVAPQDDSGYDVYDQFINDRKSAISGIKKRFEGLEKRTRHLESHIVDKEADWYRRLNN